MQEEHLTPALEEVCVALATIQRHVVPLPQRVYEGMRSVLKEDRFLSPALVRALFKHDQPLASAAVLSTHQLVMLAEYCVSDLDLKTVNQLKGNFFSVVAYETPSLYYYILFVSFYSRMHSRAFNNFFFF